MALLARQLYFEAVKVGDELRGARLRRFSARFVKIIWPGDVITSRGRVVDRRFEEGGSYAVDIEVWAENQRGELVLKGAVTPQLYYNAEDAARQRAGQGPLVVAKAEEEARLAKLSRAQSPRKPEPARVTPPPGPAPAPQRPRPTPPAARAGAEAARPSPRVPMAPPPPARGESG